MSEKFEPVEVHPQQCADSLREAHLRGFVAAFIIKSRRDRCLHILLESPKKAAQELHQIDQWLDPETSSELVGSDRFPKPLARALGSTRGVYVDGALRSSLLTPAEAATVAGLNSADAILSIIPGKRALVFHHEGSVYLCERK